MKIEYKCRFCNRIIKRKYKLKIHEDHCWSNPKNKDILKCEFCDKNFLKPGALGIHKRACLKNPNRKPLENNGNGWKYVKHKKSPYGTWKCEECNLIFETKHELYEHKHKLHLKTLKTRDTSHICEFCGEHYDNKREHNRICSKRRHSENFKWTEEEKKQISERRKQFLKEHPEEHPWKRNTKFKSEPCEHLKTILKEKGFDFIEEYTDTRWEHNYSLDIAFLEKKIAIEINGNQHYNSNWELNEYYQKRHDYLTSNGWNVLEIHYTWCYVENKIKEICEAIENNNTILFEEAKKLLEHKRLTKLEKEQKRKENHLQKEQEKLNLINKRKEQILNSEVDLTKFGWVDKVSKITKLTRRQIARIVKLTDLKDVVYIRHMTE